MVPRQPVPRRERRRGARSIAVGRRGHRAASRRRSRSSRTTSSRCWRTRRSASSATCSSPSASGAYIAAIFHMITHAFFKALLFLGAGSVIHGMHDEQDMRRMGGLRKFMPITAVDVHRRLARDRRRPAVRRLLVEGRDPRQGVVQPTTTALWVVGARRRAAHRVLHDPPGVARLLRRRALATQPRDRDRAPPRRRDARRDADARAASRTSRRGSMTLPLVVLAVLVDRRRAHQPAVRRRKLEFLDRLARAGVPAARPTIPTLVRRRVRARRRVAVVARASSASSSRTRVLPQRARRRRPRPDRRAARRRSRTVLANAYYLDAGSRAFVERPGHRGRALPRATASTAR